MQRIENGTLQLSSKLATSILEATGADPVSLRAGSSAQALDVFGNEYSKEAHQLYKDALPCDEKEMRILLLKIFQQLQLLFVVSSRGGRFKTYAINNALQRALANIADDFELTKSIKNFLLQNGRFNKRIYRVSDLRKFSEYAHILGYKDDKRYKPDKLISFQIPHGWMIDYYLIEKPILPHGANMKLQDAKFIIDDERHIPPEIQEAIDQATYWEITEFRTGTRYFHKSANSED